MQSRFWLRAVLPATAVIFPLAASADHPSLTVLGGPAGPVTTLTATPVPVGTWTAGLRMEYVDFDAFSDEELQRFAEEDEDADVHSTESLTSLSLGAAFGLTDNLTVGLSLPWVKREDIRSVHAHHHDDEEARETEDEHADDDGEEEVHADEPAEVERLGDSSGIGDTVLYGQYRFYASADQREQAAVVFGVKTPTGKTSERGPDGERLEVDLQPGSGSWDPMLGGAFSWSNDRLGINASLLYKYATEGSQDTDLGDVLAYNAAVAYRLTGGEDHHHDHGGQAAHNHSSLSLLLELNGEWRDKEDISGSRNPNSGGNVLYLSPGLRYGVADSLTASLSIGVPIITDFNGTQAEPDWRMIAGLSAAF